MRISIIVLIALLCVPVHSIEQLVRTLGEKCDTRELDRNDDILKELYLRAPKSVCSSPNLPFESKIPVIMKIKDVRLRLSIAIKECERLTILRKEAQEKYLKCFEMLMPTVSSLNLEFEG